jgi:hypothetical protein
MEMASATLRLSVDPTTGKRTITISYASDADALPHEHEDAHREVVEKLFEGGTAKPGDTIVVEREGTGKAGDIAQGEPSAKKQAAREGS